MLVNPEIERRRHKQSVILGAGAGTLTFLILFAATKLVWIALVSAPTLGLLIFHWNGGDLRRRRGILKRSFPESWLTVLHSEVPYYMGLPEDYQQRFRDMMQVFLAEVRVQGVEVEISERHKVLVAAAAVIPVLGFPDFEYKYLTDVLIYPGSFDEKYQDASHKKERILGVVHGALNNRVMVLSIHALEHGFANPSDKRNTAIHEFAHVVDKSDGDVDGAIAYSEPEVVRGWRRLVRDRLTEDFSETDIREYAGTNQQEFLAVTTEYFFEKPHQMREKHPRIYELLAKMYHQDPANLLKRGFQKRGKRKIGRNEDCPCGSGEKYKHCCLPKQK